MFAHMCVFANMCTCNGVCICMYKSAPVYSIYKSRMRSGVLFDMMCWPAGARTPKSPELGRFMDGVQAVGDTHKFIDGSDVPA